MKTKTLITLSAFLVLIMTGCCKTENHAVVVPAGRNVTLTAYVNNTVTKAGFDSEGAFYWSDGDRLGVTDMENTTFSALDLNAEDKGKAAGTFKGNVAGEIGEYAVYPYNANHSASGDMLTYYFPANYTYTKVDEDHFTAVQGDGNSFNAPMWGKIEAGSVQMKHLGGVFCIKIAEMPYASGTLTLTSDMKISGTYENIDLSAAEPQIEAAAATDETDKSVSIDFSGATKGSPGVFYVPAPIGEHDLNIKLVNGESAEQFNIHGKYNIVRRNLQRIYIVSIHGYASR